MADPNQKKGYKKKEDGQVRRAGQGGEEHRGKKWHVRHTLLKKTYSVWMSVWPAPMYVYSEHVFVLGSQ